MKGTRRFVLVGAVVVSFVVLIALGTPAVHDTAISVYRISALSLGEYGRQEVLHAVREPNNLVLDTTALQRPEVALSGPLHSQTAEVKFNASNCQSRRPPRGDRLWSPQENKFIVALCVYGRISNQAWCLRNYIQLAAVLQRTLIIPSTSKQWNYEYTLILHPAHARGCYGNETVISDVEYEDRFPGEKLAIKELYCWYPECGKIKSFQTYYWPNISFPEKSDWKNLLAHASGIQKAIPERQAVAEALGSVADVISLGDVFAMSVDWQGMPRSRCDLTLPPDPIIVSTVNGFVKNILGPSYLSAHIRRSDMLTRPVSYPILDIADCLAKKMVAYNLSVLFLATDASALEVSLMTSYIARYPSPRPLSVVMRPQLGTAESHQTMTWASDWWFKHYDAKDTAKVLFEKQACALADVFLSSESSTFSSDISKWRHELGKHSCFDKHVCTGVPRRQATQLEVVMR